MVRRILVEAGFIENETFKETRFLKPPKTTYAVFMDAFTRRGSDDSNFITEHEYTIELYSYTPDPKSEAAIESAFDALGVAFEKADRYWMQDEQLYQVIYTFDWIDK